MTCSTTSFDFTQACPAEISFAGDATCQPGGVLLTPGVGRAVGAMWLTTPYDANTATSFSLEVTLQSIPVSQSGDGFAIAMQADPRGVNALGAAGNQLGYGGTTEKIAPSLALEIDTTGDADEPTPHLRFDEDGIVVTGSTTEDVLIANVDIASGDPFTVWIDYDDQSFAAYVAPDGAAKPASPLATMTGSIKEITLGELRFGITAANGSRFGEQRVLRWNLDLVP
ncbi:MAG: L-type lectin-domain containing protein [Kofleriaceae bacterium]